ncbi:uncharacterized protein N7479_001459 [Penicillium vulpinum]|uniref:uncharacterized protein n=1 Tax=Penicillium vulpinum TaxID=29845 RepID=UPI00254977C5|nr:uncharacterized protein N7479_001459 [Penicillium vulpinum]KAJ5971541.1 hypothetical protein N7479_001459 [Penicillium vulpinum]
MLKAPHSRADSISFAFIPSIQRRICSAPEDVRGTRWVSPTQEGAQAPTVVSGLVALEGFAFEALAA